jgi:hypothetical protein
MNSEGRFSTGVALAALLCASHVFGACKIIQIAEMQVDRNDNQPLIDGQINGEPVRILIDTWLL